MSYRSITTLVFALALAGPALVSAQSKSPKGWTMPRTADGKPDLQGTWTNATMTPLERPPNFNGKATLNEEEAKAYVKNIKDLWAKYEGKADSPIADMFGSGGTGGYNSVYVDNGSSLAMVDGVYRTSLVIDPPDGKVPTVSAEARQRNMAMMRAFNKFDSVKDRPLGERCLVGFGSTSGPPMLPVLYNNTYEIVQTPDSIVILVEMVHDARIIRMNATHAPASVKQWLGDSVGHWEGDTLVVETTNFNDKTRFRGSGENLKVTERFTRVDANNILYKATMEDPTTFAKSWTIEYPFVATAGPIYEYACHEGNYSMVDILGGARKAEEEKSKK